LQRGSHYPENDTKWSVTSFKVLATRPSGKEPLASTVTGKGQGQLGCVVKGKTLLALPGIKPYHGS